MHRSKSWWSTEKFMLKSSSNISSTRHKEEKLDMILEVFKPLWQDTKTVSLCTQTTWHKWISRRARCQRRNHKSQSDENWEGVISDEHLSTHRSMANFEYGTPKINKSPHLCSCSSATQHLLEFLLMDFARYRKPFFKDDSTLFVCLWPPKRRH